MTDERPSSQDRPKTAEHRRALLQALGATPVILTISAGPVRAASPGPSQSGCTLPEGPPSDPKDCGKGGGG